MQTNTLSTVNLANGQNSVLFSGLGSGQAIDALAFNHLDGFLYGVNVTVLALGGTLLRINAAGRVSAVDLSMPQLPVVGDYNTGTIDDQGYFWVSGNGLSYIRYDLRPSSATYGQFVDSGVALSGLLSAISDWAYVAGGGDALYAVSTNLVGVSFLARFDRTTRAWTTVFTQNIVTGRGLLAPAPRWNAIYGGNGVLYASDTYTGQIWRFPITGTTGSATLVSTGPSGTLTDGARCYLAANV